VAALRTKMTWRGNAIGGGRDVRRRAAFALSRAGDGRCASKPGCSSRSVRNSDLENVFVDIVDFQPYRCFNGRWGRQEMAEIIFLACKSLIQKERHSVKFGRAEKGALILLRYFFALQGFANLVGMALAFIRRFAPPSPRRAGRRGCSG
jgi:hypothetical protein